MTVLFEAAFSATIGALLILLSFEGGRQIAVHGLKLKAIALSVVGFLGCMTYAATSFTAYSLLNQFSDGATNQQFKEELDYTTTTGNSDSQQEAFKLYAEEAFVRYGRFDKVRDEQGRFHPYTPTLSAIARREKEIRHRVLVEFNRDAQLENTIAWLAWSVTSLAFGWLMGWNGRRNGHQ